VHLQRPDSLPFRCHRRNGSLGRSPHFLQRRGGAACGAKSRVGFLADEIRFAPKIGSKAAPSRSLDYGRQPDDSSVTLAADPGIPGCRPGDTQRFGCRYIGHCNSDAKPRRWLSARLEVPRFGPFSLRRAHYQSRSQFRKQPAAGVGFEVVDVLLSLSLECLRGHASKRRWRKPNNRGLRGGAGVRTAQMRAGNRTRPGLLQKREVMKVWWCG